MNRYRLTTSAQQDLREIQAEMINEGGTRLARYIRGEITRNLVLLAENPGIGHSRTDLTPEPVKFWTAFSYLIVYDPAFSPMAVVRIVHSARDVSAMFARNPPQA